MAGTSPAMTEEELPQVLPLLQIPLPSLLFINEIAADLGRIKNRGKSSLKNVLSVEPQETGMRLHGIIPWNNQIPIGDDQPTNVLGQTA